MLNVAKCKFCQKEVRYLGHVVSERGVAMDPEKVAAIINISPPKTVKQLRSYIGMVSWYRKFINNFAAVVEPLLRLLKKDVKFKFGPDQMKAFVALKLRLTEAPILTGPDFNKTFYLQTDASYSAVAGVLTQKDDQGHDKVIAYCSKNLSDTEKKYTVSEKERLAVLMCIRKFRPYLEGYHFVLITDHSSLKWILTVKDAGGRLARWAMELQAYDFEIIHRKGALHKVPDALSRLGSDDNGVGAEEPGVFAVSQVQMEPSQDTWYNNKYKVVSQKPECFPDWQIINNKLYFHRLDRLARLVEGVAEPWKLVVPKEDRQRVLQECHDATQAAHGGVRKTFSRVALRYYWPKMYYSVQKYVRSCSLCQQHKPQQAAPQGVMGQRILEAPWVHVSADLIGPLPRSISGKKFLVVFQCLFTKYVELRALATANSKSVISAFKDLVIHRWGKPKFLVVDNGVQLVSKLFKGVCGECGVKINYTPFYTPMQNPTERVNRVLKTMIRLYLQEDQKYWDLYLSDFRYAMNTNKHDSTDFTPSYLNMGREPDPPDCLF